MSTTAAPRRISLHPTPPPPSPNILHSPVSRRTCRKQPKSTGMHHSRSNKTLLLHQQYLSRKSGEELGEGDNRGGNMLEGEKWRFQAEILRAECNFLRMERELSMKKLERKRVETEKTLKSAVQMLVSGREKIAEGKSDVNVILEDEIEELVMKLEQLQRSWIVERRQVRKCSNFNKKACTLKRRLEKTGRELPESSSMSNAGVKHKRIDQFPEFSTIQFHQDDEPKCTGRCKAIVQKIVQQVRSETEQWAQMQEMLGRVRGEMVELQTSRDYWENIALNSDCEIQSLRETVEEWRDKAVSYENKASELQLELSVAKEELQLSKEGLHSSRCRDKSLLPEFPVAPLGGKIQKEKHLYLFDENTCNAKDEQSGDESRQMTPRKNSPPISLAKQLAKEKQMRSRRSKEKFRTTQDCRIQEVGASRREKIYANSKGMESKARSPLADIENASPLIRQSSRESFPFQTPEYYSRTRERCRK